MNSRHPEPCRALRACLAALLAAALLLVTTSAAADRLMIKRPGQHPAYLFEAEPHLNIGIIDPPGVGTGEGIGAGFRGTQPYSDGVQESADGVRIIGRLAGSDQHGAP